MSGGSLDYFCFKVDEVIGQILDRATIPEHKAFAAHLTKVSRALHDLEWCWSGDTSDGDEIAAIMDCITPAELLDSALQSAKAENEALKRAIITAKKYMAEMKCKSTP